MSPSNLAMISASTLSRRSRIRPSRVEEVRSRARLPEAPVVTTVASDARVPFGALREGVRADSHCNQGEDVPKARIALRSRRMPRRQRSRSGDRLRLRPRDREIGDRTKSDWRLPAVGILLHEPGRVAK